MTQEEFAGRFGFSVNTLRHWEQGKRQQLDEQGSCRAQKSRRSEPRLSKLPWFVFHAWELTRRIPEQIGRSGRFARAVRPGHDDDVRRLCGHGFLPETGKHFLR
jgi:hypothetical protein